MAPDFERFARMPWPMASLASSGIKAFSSAFDRSWSIKACRVLRNRPANSAQEFEALISTTRTAVFEAKFMLPWSFSEEAAAEKYMSQVQHNMWVVAARSAVLSIITGGAKWVEITTHADPLYQHLMVTAERKFWRCVESGEPPRLFGVEPPKPRIEAIRVVDMSASNSWAEFADLFRSTRQASLEHERSKAELKALMPEDAKEATGHGVRAKRSKSGAISFDLQELEGDRAAL